MLTIGKDYIGFIVLFFQLFYRFKLSNIKGKKNPTTFFDFSFYIWVMRGLDKTVSKFLTIL